MENEALKRRVNGRIEDRSEEMIDRFESMGLAPDVWTPDVERLRDHEAFFETQPYREVGYDDRPNVVATVEGAGDGPTLALSGHMDVVPATESEWDHDPFSMEREGDRRYGRGTADMKGGIAAFVHAVDCIRALDIELAGDLYLQSTLEEEDGGVGGLLSVLMRGYCGVAES